MGVVDGPKFYQRARHKSPDTRRCKECRGMHHMPEGAGIVSSTTRYEDDVVAQLVVEMYPDGVPGEVVGELLGITRQRVSQIEIRALRKLRGSKVSGNLWEIFNDHHAFTEQLMKKRWNTGLRIVRDHPLPNGADDIE